MHLFNGQVPVSLPGDFKYWAGMIPGDTSTTLWTETHPYQDLPRVIDPASGWLQNANDPPWTTTFPLALDRLSALYGTAWTDEFRAQRSAQMLSEDEHFLSEIVKYKHSTFMELADRLLDELIPLHSRVARERVGLTC